MEPPTDTLNGIGAVHALNEIATELAVGFNFERYGVRVDRIDLEHFRHALDLVRMLISAQEPAVSPARTPGTPTTYFPMFGSMDSPNIMSVTKEGLCE